MARESDRAGGDAYHLVIVMPEGRKVRVPDNANLREAFLREDVRLYFGTARILNCGGHARCGTCRVRVLEGAASLSEPTPFEKERLPEAGSVVRLACQANVRGDVSIDPRGSEE